ncbi:AIR synthase family protein [Dehalogenimonas alkenigignens]|uniref:Hydrogenase maturation factor n=1 Tax=Dehalogenimonas alkenigignens TaxID=1217799 RepID=A0A0W0GHV9_9CHLR|nr:AIR synthase family protein [Dehalogenimonas alkenigignens]KTB48143.1 Hydrogenase maturation factor [Dehalogenimonas alkenigignens]PVV84383.1 AIR synthase [Dehalogenimonas alkenigignens]
MTELPEIGKISPEIFREIIFPRLGAKSDKVLVGPQHGVDVGIADIGGQAVSFTTDPVFIVPQYGFKRAAWFAIHIIASDSVTSGLRPKFLSIDLNLPMSMTKEELATMWDVMHKECEKMGINVITGHTARYDGCAYPMVGGATMLGVGGLDEYVSPRFARPGDKIIITKGPAIEACGIFAAMFPDLIAQRYGEPFARRAESLFFQMSVVEDALTAVTVGVRDAGISSMHDATECGLWGGLYEVAQAAGCGARIEKDKIVIEDGVPEICRMFGIDDPYAAISEGSLIITCRPHRAAAVVNALSARGIKSSIAGELTDPEYGMILAEGDNEKPLKHPIVDPFWRAFYDAAKKQAA